MIGVFKKIFLLRKGKMSSFISTDLLDVEKDHIVLDYGSQYNQLISRRIREIEVSFRLQDFGWRSPMLSILSGLYFQVVQTLFTKKDRLILIRDELEIPVLRICYGMQLLTQLGGKAFPRKAMLVIVNTVNQHWPAQSLLFLLGRRATCLDEPMLLQKFLLTLFIGTSANCHMHLWKPDRKFTVSNSTQEVRHSVHGYDILRNFALNICGAKGDWTMDNFIRDANQTNPWKGGRQENVVLLGLSGGVDSSVVGVLLQKAIGDQLIYL